jgi:hypothetical protein
MGNPLTISGDIELANEIVEDIVHSDRMSEFKDKRKMNCWRMLV